MSFLPQAAFILGTAGLGAEAEVGIEAVAAIQTVNTGTNVVYQ